MDSRKMMVNKIYFEARYEPNLLVYHNAAHFQKKWKSIFPNVNVDLGEKITLVDEEKTKEIFASVSNMGANFNGKHLEEFISTSEQLVDFVCGTGEITTFERFGVRMELIIPIDNMAKEQEKVLLKLFGKSAPFQIGKDVGGVSWSISARDDQLHSNVNFAFVQKNENINASKNDPNYGFLSDVDLFLQGKVDVNKAKELLDSAHWDAKRKAGNFINTLFA